IDALGRLRKSALPICSARGKGVREEALFETSISSPLCGVRTGYDPALYLSSSAGPISRSAADLYPIRHNSRNSHSPVPGAGLPPLGISAIRGTRRNSLAPVRSRWRSVPARPPRFRTALQGRMFATMHCAGAKLGDTPANDQAIGVPRGTLPNPEIAVFCPPGRQSIRGYSAQRKLQRSAAERRKAPRYSDRQLEVATQPTNGTFPTCEFDRQRLFRRIR